MPPVPIRKNRTSWAIALPNPKTREQTIPRESKAFLIDFARTTGTVLIALPLSIALLAHAATSGFKLPDAYLASIRRL